MTIFLASANSHKIEEMKEILGQSVSPAEILSLNDGYADLHVDETGKTLEENAFIKAKEYYSATGIASMADDTGLEIDALGGAPGVYSARFAGESGDSAANRAKVLEMMKDIPDEGRTARFRTVICFADDIRTLFAEGVCEGRISREERGEQGFGYDSIFIPEGFDRTFAEMASDEKNSVSHRGRALRDFALLFPKYYNEAGSDEKI